MPEEINNTNNYQNKMRIYFGDDLANLFDVGYISTDIHQIISFTLLLEENNIEDINKYFLHNKFGLTRYSKVLSQEKMKKSRISDVKKGSVELVIDSANLVSSILVPIVVIKVNKYFEQRAEVVNFNIKVDDIRLQQLLDNYEQGYFGDGDRGLQSIINLISDAGYSIDIISNNTYTVEDMLNMYTKRIVKTIKKYR